LNFTNQRNTIKRGMVNGFQRSIEDGYKLLGIDKKGRPLYLSPEAQKRRREQQAQARAIKRQKNQTKPEIPQKKWERGDVREDGYICVGIRKNGRPEFRKSLKRKKAKRIKNREKERDYQKEYRKKNPQKYDPEKARAYRIARGQNPKTKREKKPKMSHAELRASVNAAFKTKMKTDPFFKMKHAVRTRIGSMVRKIKSQKPAKTEEIIGCSWIKLKKHIESQFTKGMEWENHGNNGWHLDHIIPLSCATTIKGLAKLCHYTNLRPLWKTENLSKGAKLHLI